MLAGCCYAHEDGDGAQRFDGWHIDWQADGRQVGCYGDLHSYGDGAREQVALVEQQAEQQHVD